MPEDFLKCLLNYFHSDDEYTELNSRFSPNVISIRLMRIPQSKIIFEGFSLFPSVLIVNCSGSSSKLDKRIEIELFITSERTTSSVFLRSSSISSKIFLAFTVGGSWLLKSECTILCDYVCMCERGWDE
ncbi:hypothetical protein Avbf_17510 [Armadillidium vulgare]|nr:hypothetical protein Avbf_17510 [Armadillidium vulgare]